MVTLDETDRRILLALDADPRAPVLLLAQELGLARKTVQTRLVRLETEEVLRPHSDRVSPASLGYQIGAFVSAEVEQALLEQAVDALRAVPEVLAVGAMTGDSDLVCQVVAVDPADLYRVGQEILACPGIRRTNTILIMRDLIPYRMTALLAAAPASARVRRPGTRDQRLPRGPGRSS